VVPLHRSQLAGAQQWVHGRALYGGMVEDQPWAQPPAWRAYEQNSPFLRSLRSLSYGQSAKVVLETEDLARLHDDGFSRIVFDRFSWSKMPRRVAFDPEIILTQAFGAPIHRSNDGVVWALPAP